MARAAVRARVLFAVCLVLTLSACGFHLRGSNGSFMLPFATMHIGLPDTSPLAIDLKRYIRAIGSTEIVDTRDGADAALEVLSDPENTRTKTILSLNSNGRVRQYLLQYTIVFRVLDRQGNELLGPTTISLSRPIDFNETQLLAKEQEEALLYKDMQTDLVQQMMRRMAAVKTTRMSVPGPGPAPQDPSAAPAVPIL